MGLDAKIQITIGGSTVCEVCVHPQTPMSTVLEMLQDLCESIRKDLASSSPVLSLHERTDVDTGSPSDFPAADYCSRSICNLIEASLQKMEVAMQLEDHEAAERHFERAQRLAEWENAQFSGNAIEAGPVPS